MGTIFILHWTHVVRTHGWSRVDHAVLSRLSRAFYVHLSLSLAVRS